MSLPSSPSRFSSRRSITPSKSKAVDVGKPLGVYDTNTVRDRVRQWQAQGGGVITADDVGEEDDVLPETIAPKSRSTKGEGTPRTPCRSEKQGSEQHTPSRSGRTPGRGNDNEKKDRARSRSAPAKRIVSDGHWKKKRSPPKGTSSSRAARDKASARTQLDDGPSSGSPANKDPKEKRIRTPNRESFGGDDGIRVYVTPPGSQRDSKHRRQRKARSDSGDSGLDQGSDLGRAGADPREDSKHRRNSSKQDESLHADRDGSNRDSDRRHSSAFKRQDMDGSPKSIRGALSESRGSIKSQKGNILSQVFGDSRRKLAKEAPEPIPTPRAPSIEAWLNETPDPFVEADESPLEFIAPLRPSVEKKKSSPLQEVVEEARDPNEIWDALDTKEGTRRVMSKSKRNRRIPSSAIYNENPFPADFDSDSGILTSSAKSTTSASKFVDLVQDSPKASEASLKRRSAGKSVSSPVRDRARSVTSKQSPRDDDVTSGLSTNQTSSSVEPLNHVSPLKPPGLNARRPFPTTGRHRLSTIASVETFSTRHGVPPPSISEKSERTIHPTSVLEDEATDEIRDRFDPNSLKRTNSRLTKHADLISVLSLPQAGTRSIQSARSIRTNRSRLATATSGDLMRELATDEGKYMRELRTLVDGVIPVLLTCVLSKSDSAVAAGLFRPSAAHQEDPNFTRPIVDMGIALERLKTLHKRIPLDSPTALMTWAHGAQRVYAEYLKAWRMGFQDVVVNLAPAADESSTSSSSHMGDTQGLDEGMARNEAGDVVNGDGERVDVAFLLKRPLVRLKYLQKTLKGLNFVNHSSEAQLLADKYQKLVDNARQRSNEERARLEDEAASNIDPTRTRDPRTLAPLAGVVVDRTRRVRARDNFNLALQHSSGQCVDCRVELVLRDEASDSGVGGDLLVCEVDATGKWLLFPPIQSGRLSARNGDLKGEIVVMIRGAGSDGSEWQELLSFRSEDEQAGFEWVQMLGLTPVPPQITRSQSFLIKHHKRKSASKISLAAPVDAVSPSRSRTPSPREVEIPIGERTDDTSKSWMESFTDGLTPLVKDTIPRDGRKAHETVPNTPSRSQNYVDQVSDLRSLPSQTRNQGLARPEIKRQPRSFKEALGLSGTSTTIGLKRTRAKRLSRHGGDSPSGLRPRDEESSDREPHQPSFDASSGFQSETSSNGPSQLRSSSSEPARVPQEDDRSHDAHQPTEITQLVNDKSCASVPSMELPYIPKARKNSPPTTPTFEVEQEPEWPSPNESQLPSSPSKLTKKRPASSNAKSQSEVSPPAPPAPPEHGSPKSVSLIGSKTPILARNQPKPRRSSSPLKHQYEPSTASESSSDSEASTVERKGSSSVSDSSEDEDSDEDTPTPLLPLGPLKQPSKTKITPKVSSRSTPEGSIKPSESASQAPYKTVPAQPAKASKTIASIFSWSDTGSWQSLHADECSIVITPGLIEAYEMSAAHSKQAPLSSKTPVVDGDAFSDLASNMTGQFDEVESARPLIGLELTPLVPLRRGTALDISLRSPPTPNSQITSGNNIMFRSRNPEECEALYALINHSRINNPTFIALQNARASGSSFNADRRASTSAGGSRQSWFGGWGRSSSYRASSASTPSIAPSDSSIGSMSSAFSALKRFGGRGSSMFNISRSTVMSREGSRANSIYTSSDNSSGSGTSSPVPPGMMTAGKDAPIGLNNAKIRLYVRETASKWRDMGSARLTIMRPETSNSNLDGRPPSSGMHQAMTEKRVLVHGKTKGEVLLDEQLGENCFERVARTGIAISVWEDVVGPNGEVGVVGAVGGVGGGRATVYMIQVRFAWQTGDEYDDANWIDR